MRIFSPILALAIFALPSTGLAWLDQGHMMVAAIAWKRLTPAVKIRANALLNLNPAYRSWLTEVPHGAGTDLREEIIFAKAATWADAIKIDPEYVNEGDTPLGSYAARNIGYADRMQHRYWHYIDLPFSPDGTAITEAAAPNAETQIELFETAIASDTVSDDVKSYDLAWLLHLVGDVHQPLHTISRYTASFPAGDRGGNLEQICERPCRDVLHFFWDGVVGRAENPITAITAANALPDAPSRLASVTDDRVWIEESFEIARNSVYVAPIGLGPGPYKLTDEYKRAALMIADGQIEAAGARLGNLVNIALK